MNIKNLKSPLFRPRRIGVTGALTMGKTSIQEAFCRGLGDAIVRRGALVVTRGGKASSNRKSRIPVDQCVVDSAVASAASAGVSAEQAIETMVGVVTGQRELFHVGTVTPLRGKTYEAQRFAFADHVDGLIGIGGRRGTIQTLTLGLAIELPILPVPTFGGASAEMWEEHGVDIRESLQLSETDLTLWKHLPQDHEAATQLALQMLDQLLSAITRRCFVIMPFQVSHSALYDFVIEPAVKGLGHECIRLDRLAAPGNVGAQVELGIREADYVVVVLDGMRPNVIYELGLAHGQGKPAILMNQRGSLNTEGESIPFDLTMEQRLEYDAIDRLLPEKLQKVIGSLDLR